MNQLVFMPIVGIPDGTVSNAAIPDYESVLTHPRMVEQVDPTDPTRLLTVCQAPGYGKAYPARRIVQVAQSLDEIGAMTLLGSICEADGWVSMLNRFAEAVLRQAQPIYGSR